MTNGSHPEAVTLSTLEDTHFESSDRRRLQAAISLTLLWGCVIALHLLAWGQWIVYGLTAITGAHFFRLLVSHPTPLPKPLPSWQAMAPPTLDSHQTPPSWPYVSILVAAKNEVAVIEQLVETLMKIDYPPDRYEVWLIDDNSDDGTAELLDRLQLEFATLHVAHRDGDAVGGKSGALNQVWRKAQGSLIAVFDADAQVSPDCLRRIVPIFDTPDVGAVQMRKAIANSDQNFLTRGQVAEMAFDAYCQLKRITCSGIGELRGNGQIVRRSALEQCGGWNEETITDDLDLTFRLHLTGWNVFLAMFPAVYEEGVVRTTSLWHQRNRWAEGGYQRYLDYWRFLLNPQYLGWNKVFDLFIFWVVQYALPTAAFPDLALALVRNRLPMLTPLSGLVVLFSTVGMANGLWRTQQRQVFTVLLQTLRGMTYMMHWFVVMGTVTLRMSVRPKRLKWVKTQHVGDDTTLEITASSQ